MGGSTNMTDTIAQTNGASEADPQAGTDPDAGTAVIPGSGDGTQGGRQAVRFVDATTLTDDPPLRKGGFASPECERPFRGDERSRLAGTSA